MLSQSFGYRHKSLEIRLYPSKIHFTNCVETTSNHNITAEPIMEAFCEKVLEKGEYPRLQVTEKDGQYFTLNNTRLHLFKRLQDMGYCSKVTVEKIPLSEIPCGIREMMIVTQETTFKPKQHGSKRCGYLPVDQKDQDRKSDSDLSSEDDLDDDDSDLDSDLDESSDDDDDDEDDDERVCEGEEGGSCPESLEEPSVEEEERLL